MIFFTGFVLILCGVFARAVLQTMGIFSINNHRWTDLWTVVPFWSGVGCWLWVLWTLCARFLP